MCVFKEDQGIDDMTGIQRSISGWSLRLERLCSLVPNCYLTFKPMMFLFFVDRGECLPQLSPSLARIIATCQEMGHRWNEVRETYFPGVRNEGTEVWELIWWGEAEQGKADGLCLRSKKVSRVRKVVQLPLLGTVEPYNTLASRNKPRIREREVKAERSRILSAA